MKFRNLLSPMIELEMCLVTDDVFVAAVLMALQRPSMRPRRCNALPAKQESRPKLSRPWFDTFQSNITTPYGGDTTAASPTNRSQWIKTRPVSSAFLERSSKHPSLPPGTTQAAGGPTSKQLPLHRVRDSDKPHLDFLQQQPFLETQAETCKDLT
ncbi:hypothetical protein AC579_1214 [Pseudocercospora musae]|uniref:Uncharacterized protein n=1 Tax=Pseudocercospora musae TaxID=113226 RepID=A0A139HZF0_9PEZI|nr:hypothetical protein AC579_1214 [Pseudocercospora musae]